MATHEEAVRSHPAQSIAAQLVAAQSSQTFAEMAADPQVAWLSQRIFGFASLLQDRLNSVPAALISIPVLAQLQSPLQSALSEVTAFVQNRNVGHLLNAASQIDGAGYQWLSQIPTIAGKANKASLGKIADDYANQVRQLISDLTEQKKKLEQENERLQVSLTEQAAQLQQLTGVIAQQKGEAQATAAEVKRDYAKAEQELRAQFDKSLAANEEKYRALLEQWTIDVATKRAETDEAVAHVLEQLNAKRAQAAEIVQIVGNIGVTGNYKNTAAEEGEAADLWRVITLGAFVVAISLGTWALWSLHEVSWVTAVVRMLFAFVVLSVTLYTGRESARHRANADQARRTELELASLGPFIESLPLQEQHALRSKLADRYFGNSVASQEVSSPVPAASVIDLLKTAISALGRR